jgi:hypothetical protein
LRVERLLLLLQQAMRMALLAVRGVRSRLGSVGMRGVRIPVRLVV